MSDPAPNRSHLVFGDFLEHLRRQGFTIGVDQYLRLQELLNRVSGHCAPADLKTILCPIFASNERQQSQFYSAFDSYFDFSLPIDEDKAVETENELPAVSFTMPTPMAARRWPYLLGASLIVALALALAMVLAPKPQVPAIQSEQDILQQEPANEPQTETQQAEAQPQEIEQPGTEGQPELETVAVEPAPPAEAEPKLSFYQQYATAIRLALIVAPVVFFLFYEWYRYNRRRLALQRQRGRKPPYIWPIRVEAATPRFYDSEDFYTVARLMRRRQVGEFHRLDVNATIAATIESLGYPRFRYRPDSKPPEYLALIDRASFRDHQAQLFGELTRALEEEGLFIAHYFYEGDPRVCCNEAGDCFHLAELRDKYPEDRLLVFGNGERIIDPVTGRLESWASTLLEWQDRAVLTPEAATRWGLREITLAEQFILLPATVKGLLTVVDHFESSVSQELRSWRQDGLEAPPRELDRPGVVEALRNYLGEETFQWLCACAVYPELHWDLTLYLASLPCMEKDLVREKNLLRLIRLPWFRSGAMPDDLRWLLIRELDRDKERAIRSAIIELLEKNPPPKETIAENVFQLNLAVQRWLFRRSRNRRREMLQVMRSLPQSQATRDYTLLRFLESSGTSPLDLLLPRRLQKVFYRGGVPAFGLRTGTRLLATLIIVALAWVIVRPPASPEQTEQPPTDEPPISEVSFPPPEGMVFIKGGTFTMGFDGSDDESEKPEHVVTMNAFFIDKTEVTVGDYYKFIKAKNHRPPESWSQAWNDGTFRASEERLPVAGINWFDAKAYAVWAKKRLPTEQEWEYAARGRDTRLYPWGNNYDPARANVADSQHNMPVAVGSYYDGESPFGVVDMAGNVAEWTDSDSSRYPGSLATPKPGKIVRGGSFRASKIYAMTTTRTVILPDRWTSDLGFRCVKDAPENFVPPPSSPVTVARAQNRNLNASAAPSSNRNQSLDQRIMGELIGDATYLGKGIPGVDITIVNMKSGVARSTSTDATGSFRVPSLQPGVYRVTASKRPVSDAPLGRYTTMEGVQINPKSTTRISLALASSGNDQGVSATTGSVVGILYDSEGKPVSVATITLTNQESGLSRTTLTSNTGYYGLSFLPPNRYTITASKQGYETKTIPDFTVRLSERNFIIPPIRLEPSRPPSRLQ